MIVDDSLFMRKMLRDIVEEEGCQVVAEAADGEEAVAKFAELRPDLVTLDIVMPNKNGIEALKEIVTLDPAARVVMVSSMGQENLVAEAKGAGARDFVIKPFAAQAVAQVLKTVLQG